jgi:hypothetical protein
MNINTNCLKQNLAMYGALKERNAKAQGAALGAISFYEQSPERAT